jgi:hypothetical protein
MPDRISGTEGYAEEAEYLLRQYESIRFADVHRQVAHLFPVAPARILDIGSGTGRDVAGFAAIIGVEPTAALRSRATELHPSQSIEWVDDGLPELTAIVRRGVSFELAMLTAVWMHLDEGQRRKAMPTVAGVVTASGKMMLSLRHGPVPP